MKSKNGKSRPKQQYVLVQDCDCHWYVCPADKQEEANTYFEKIDEYWSKDNYLGQDLPPEEPSYLKRVGGAPSLVKFTHYTIE